MNSDASRSYKDLMILLHTLHPAKEASAVGGVANRGLGHLHVPRTTDNGSMPTNAVQRRTTPTSAKAKTKISFWPSFSYLCVNSAQGLS